MLFALYTDSNSFSASASENWLAVRRLLPIKKYLLYKVFYRRNFTMQLTHNSGVA